MTTPRRLGALTIPAGSLTGDIVISALSDGVLDNRETVVVTLRDADDRPLGW